jgi:hypothetical protein
MIRKRIYKKPVKSAKRKGAWGFNKNGITAWKVIINGKDSGIQETHYQFASKYWKGIAQKKGAKIKLQKV